MGSGIGFAFAQGLDGPVDEGQIGEHQPEGQGRVRSLRSAALVTGSTRSAYRAWGVRNVVDGQELQGL